MTSLGKPSNVASKLENLRAQKHIITSYKLPEKALVSLIPDPFPPAITVLRALHRMQKLSGHLHSVLSLSLKHSENTNDCNEARNDSNRCNWPLISRM